MDISQSNWSETDASNDTAAPDGFPEGMAPSGVNNAARAIMGAVKRWFNQSVPATTAGTSTAYTLSYGVAPTALADGMTFLVKFNAACGDAPTLNVNLLGAKSLYKWQGGDWVAVASGDIASGQKLRVAYDSTSGNFHILQPIGTAAQYNVGNQANNVVQLDGNAKLPAVDGSQLTGVQQFTTGDVKETYKTTADTGWVMLDDGSVGDASSGGTTRANADCEALFTVLWGISSLSIQDSSGSSSTKGATAAADWAAHKRMLLPLRKGRSPIGSGTGSGLTGRSLGASGGAETTTVSGNVGNATNWSDQRWSGAGSDDGAIAGNHTHSFSATPAIMPPWSATNWMIKL